MTARTTLVVAMYTASSARVESEPLLLLALVLPFVEVALLVVPDPLEVVVVVDVEAVLLPLLIDGFRSCNKM